MSLNPSSKSGSEIAPMILPASVVLLLYAMWTVLLSAPGSENLPQLEKQRASLRQVGVSTADVAVLREESKALTAELEAVRQRLAASQQEALTLCGKEVAKVDQLETLDNLGCVFQQSGMTVTADRTSTERSRMKLAATLDSATQAVLDEVNKSRQTGEKKARYLPPNLPRDVSPEQYLASVGGGQRLRAVEQQMREVEVVGGYREMLSALAQLNERCCNSVVVGLAVRRPADLAAASSLRLWTLQLQVRPTPADITPPGELKPDGVDPMQLVADQSRAATP